MAQFRDAPGGEGEENQFDDEEEEEEEEEEEPVRGAEDDDDGEWQEESEACRSLFSPETFPSVEAAMEHDAKSGFDVAAFAKLSVYDRIKVVNWCRTSGEKNFASQRAEWDSETFLRPVVADDPYLTWEGEMGEEEGAGEAVIDDRLRDEMEAVEVALKEQGLSLSDLQN